MDPKNNDGSTEDSFGIAIIGLGGCFPDAPSVATYWDNICKNHVAIGKVPPERWDPALYFSKDRSVPDTTYSQIGGFVRKLDFDAKRFRIPPRTLDAIDELQKMALMVVAEALEDAGLQVFANATAGQPFNRDRTAVIMGNAMGGEAEDQTSLRVWFAEAKQAMRLTADACAVPAAQRDELLQRFEQEYKSHLPQVTEDSMPGELSNCITGRIANAFDLRGPNFTTDAACAASMAAMQTAVRGLRNGDYDVALVGGADRSMDPPTYVKFSKIGALSADWSAPFDARANGFVMGEGVGVLVLKRLCDAERDGNKVYAVIRGVGAASDGKGKGMTAPNPRGQRMAIQRAYEEARVPLHSVGLFEAHGTSTNVGDATELQVLTELLRESGSPARAVPIGSVKSMIGHLKSAAGAAAVIKSALALHHKKLPPSANFQKAPEHSPLNDGYLRVNTATAAWAHTDGPRRAGVSAFGFGGTNFHVVLEEYIASPPQAGQPAAAPASLAAADLGAAVVALFADKTGYVPQELDLTHQLESDLGIDTVKQAEILGVLRSRYNLPQDKLFRLTDTPTLQSVIDYVVRMGAASQASAPSPTPPPPASVAPPAPAAAGGAGAPGASDADPQVLVFGGADGAAAVQAGRALLAQASTVTLRDATAPRVAAMGAAGRVAFVAQDLAEARRKAEDAGKGRAKILAARGIYLAEGEALAQRGKVAFLFPGQGSQYVGMMRDLAAQFPVVADTFAEADRVLAPLIGCVLTEIVWAAAADEAAELKLRETQYCQPAMLTADVAMMRLLQAHGVNPAMVAGHSLGEYGAAVAAGVLTFADALYAVSARGREMAGVKVADNGKMAVVAADAVKVQAVLDSMQGYVIAANKNCHTQTVIAGESAAVTATIARFAEQGIESREIPVSHAFHSSIVAPAEGPLARVLQGLQIGAPITPILSNVDANYYPQDRDAIIVLMAKQLASPVEFIAQVERMYQDGARIFVEVGPRRAITGFVRNILGTREHRALASNHHKKPGVEGFHELLAALASDGVQIAFNGQSPVTDAAPRVPPAYTVATPAATSTAAATPAAASTPTVISGMSAALPTEQPLVPVQSDAWASLLSGHNFIEPLSTRDRRDILERNVVRLDKAGGQFTVMRELADVVQLAARFGNFDLTEAYGVESSLADALDATGKLAIAVGLDALRDAGLPLVRRYRETSTGKRLPDRWILPPDVGTRTGVIMAAAFPGVDRLLEDAAKHAAAGAARRTAAELEQFVEQWAQTLRDPAEAQRLRNAYTERASALRDEAARYAFNRKWLFRVLSMGHAQLAQIILAQGPNTQVNAACASGTQALVLAQDWIRLGRCDRVVVVTADAVTHEATLPWFAAAFLSAGAATVEANVAAAAVPFGAQRNGMILGAGAAAFIVEREDALAARGIEPIVDLVYGNIGNSAFHGSRLDGEYIRGFMDAAVEAAAQASGESRPALAKKLFFMSHETYTPARGGSSAAEVDGLRHAFGAAVTDVLIANTKGYTGHPMGATLEDAATIKGLQRQQLPPVANLTEVDPAFADLRFAKGAAVQAEWGMRFAAGFGSQVAVALYRRRAKQEARLIAPQAYAAWLEQVTGRSAAGLEISQRVLRVAEQGGQAIHQLGIEALTQPRPGIQGPAAQHEDTALPVAAAPAALDARQLLVELTALFAEQTGYDIADLAPDHALESDLGIDTVKQAELFGVIRARYGLPGDEKFNLAEVHTLERIAAYVAAKAPAAGVSRATPVTGEAVPTVASPAAVPVQQAAVVASSAGAPEQDTSIIGSRAPASEQAAHNTSAVARHAAAPLDRQALLAEVTQLFADHSGYALADLEPGHALEADLGIDTVKQAEIFGVLRKRYGMPQDAQFRLSDVQTLHAVVDYVATQRPPAPASRSAAAPASAAASAPASVATAARAPASGAAAAPMSRADLVREITAMFADHTGYAASELDPRHHLEGDLGIDTVKQAEIFAQIRQRYGLSQDENFRLNDVQSLEKIAEYVAQRQAAAMPTDLASAASPAGLAPNVEPQPSAPVASSAAVLPTSVPVAPAAGALAAGSASAPTAVDRSTVVARLVELFAQQTGYDPADLHPDHALEADLGIDTVKQAEIFGVVRSEFGLAQDTSFRLSDVQTLHAIADYVVANQALPPPPPAGPGGASAAAPQATVQGNFSYRPVALVPVSPTRGTFQLAGKRVVVVSDNAEAQGGLRAALTAQGAQVHALDWSRVNDLQLTERLSNLAGQVADALVCVLESTPREPEAVQQQVVKLIGMARSLARARSGSMEGAGLLMVSQQGGAFGFHNGQGNALVFAGASGITKSLTKEWTGARCLAVDVGDTVAWDRGAQLAVEGWLAHDPSELLHHADAWWMPRRQKRVILEAAPLAANSVVLATGGARGVTYGLLKALAGRGPLRMVILSRTAGTSPADSPLTDRSEAEQKDLAKAALAVGNERVTPAAIRRWIEREQVRLEIDANLQALRQLGTTVELVACDVSDAAALARAVEHVRWRYGAVDVLLHGAGMEESRYLVDKDPVTFAKTFAPKAAAALRLWDTVRPRRMVAMGSVAGRFGNGAQVDYAAANETMAAVARSAGSGFLNLGWTAWGDVGMATRGSVRQVLEQLGVELLPAELGAQLGADLIASTLQGDVVVAGELGRFDTSEDVTEAAGAPRPLPKIFSRADARPEGLVLSRVFDPSRDVGLEHHRIDGVAVLPGVIGVEMLTQAAAYHLGRQITCLHDVHFDAPVKLFRDAPLEVQVEVRPRTGAVDLLLVSQFTGPGGRMVRREHFRACAHEQPEALPPELATPPALEILGDAAIGRDDVYRRYFHGASFQVLQRIVSVGENGADAQPLSTPPAWLDQVDSAAFSTAPMWREAGFQIAGLWEMVELGRMGLPAGIGTLWCVARPQGTCTVEARRISTEARGSTFDVWVRDADGRVCDVMRGYRTITLRDLTADERFEPVHQQQTSPTSMIVPIEEVQGLLREGSDAALERYLSPSERARFAGLLVQKRRLEWLAARIAAKRLIRAACFGREGAIVPYHAITIHRDALGAPEVEIVGEGGPAPRVSMSHSDGVAAAFLSPQPNMRPGIDVERVEERDPTFAETYFTAEERAEATGGAHPERALTEIWAVKEAMLKALGLGARVDFREVVAMPGASGWQVSLEGEALKRAEELGTGDPEVQVEVDGVRVIARVLLPVGDDAPAHDDSTQARA